VTEPALWEQAAACYEMAGVLAEAARCYESAGAFRRAADLYVHVGQPVDAARAYARGGNLDDAAWLLVHHLDDPGRARALFDESPSGDRGPSLLRRIVLGRCDVAEGARQTVLPLLTDVQEALAGRTAPADQRIEDWSVSIAEALHRYDQVALVFAAAVRGRRWNAAQRWSDWALEHLGTAIVIPDVDDRAEARAEEA
jgi:hypothetical protein